MNIKKKEGFTLVEIMIVVMIIGLLAAIALPSFTKSRNEAREKTCINNLRLIEHAKEQYTMDNDLATGASIPDSEVEEYIKNTPSCPAGGSYTYGVVDTAPTCDADDADHEVNDQI